MYYDYFCRKLAEQELQTNIAQYEKFTLPSGQQIEKENILSANFLIWFVSKTLILESQKPPGKKIKKLNWIVQKMYKKFHKEVWTRKNYYIVMIR